MNLLFVHDGPIYYDQNGNYYEYAYHGLYERYSYLGEHIYFLMRTSPIEANTNNTILTNKVKVISVPNINGISLYLKNIMEAKKIIKRAVGQADILVARGGSYSAIAIEYAKKNHISYIFECVGCSWDAFWNHSLKGKIVAPYLFLRDKRLVKNSPYVCYVTNEFLQRRYPTTGKSVSCSNVFITPVENSVLERRIEKIHTLKKTQKIVIGTAAAIDVKYKGQEYVIKAVKKLTNKGFDLEYRMAGGNQHHSNYLFELAKSLGVSDRVKYVGSLNQDEMREFYDSLDIYIQPSKQEGLPRAVIEAMSRGIPVAGSDIAGIPELLQKQFLFRKGNVNEIARILEFMMNADLSDVARENFIKAKQYEIDVITKRRNSFYDVFLRENII